MAGTVLVADGVDWFVAARTWETLFVEAVKHLPPESGPAVSITNALNSLVFYLDLRGVAPVDTQLVAVAVQRARDYYRERPSTITDFLEYADDLLRKLQMITPPLDLNIDL